MARRIVIECDKCHSEIKGDPIGFGGGRTDHETGKLIIDDKVDNQTYELCDECWVSSVKLFEGGSVRLFHGSFAPV